MSNHKHRPWLAVASLALGIGAPAAASASTATQSPGYLPPVTQDKAQIAGSVNDNQKIALVNTRSAYALATYDKGALPATQSFSDLSLVLKRSVSKQQEFDNLLSAQANPSSPYFHHWLTAAQIGLFAPNPSDVTKVTAWLRSHGLKVKDVSPDGMIIHFSGNTASLNSAFNASMHSYQINGEKHFANANAAQIPAALAPIVQFVRLHNFLPKPQHMDVGVVSKNKANGRWKMVAKADATANGKPTAQFTVPGGTVDPQTTYDVAPADFNTIYNVNPLWNQGTRGAGQTIVVLERTDVNPADILAFRKAFLPADAKGSISYIHPNSCTDPGVNGDESEAALDAEWAGAAAPDANIVFASCADSGSDFGAFQAGFGMAATAGQAPGNVWSLSYGECESAAGGDTTASLLWSDAEAEGVTVFVSTGDAGSAACDQNAIAAASGGAQVNIMASTPYNVAVGGTDFNDLNNYSQYWTSTNLALNASAISYVPEQTWNDSCASSVLDGLMGYANGIDACNSSGEGSNYLDTGGAGGGPSNVFPQPAWQTGVYGQTNFSSRTLPDVSLFAANGLYGHALVYCMSDANENGTACNYSNPDDVYYNSAGGTSFAAPAMAGVQALINQATGDTSGNILPALYNIGSKQYGTNATPNKATVSSCDASNGASIGSSCVFNNVTLGNIDEPCWAGTANCYLGPNSNSLQSFGVIYATPSQSSLTLVPAWNAGPGYNMATGLGSVNVTNLVNAVVAFEKPFHRANKYVAPYDFMSSNVTITDWFSNDGFSDIAVVDPVKGSITTLAMKGSVIRGQVTQPSTPGQTVANAADYFPALDALGLDSAHLAWTGPDNQLYVWVSDDIGGFYQYQVAPYAAGWKLLGSEVTDSSGAPQLLWYNASASQYAWWKLGTDPSTGAPTLASNSGAIAANKGDVPTMADVNGDGYGDLVWTNPANNTVTVWINNQQGGYATHTIANRPSGYTLVGAGDFNGDGITDLVWVNTSTHDLQIWTMNGFTVTKQKTISYNATYTLAAIADYDGDGLADLLWVNTKGAVFDWQSDGSGGFQKLQVATPDGTPFKVPAGSSIQPNWLQGSATGGIADPPALASH
ncbi:protease pro-enzyme activation domain-containing protein [Dyella acidiphila]|uniref:VCBS repeat-containing protein n=1 Tax=Dyella acidiphila TaxID=2775866 RepID=A0ABR9GAN2_9GAMM|nr:protease pro-enzyme activation domain-containing protein [Dyella acidiphila]MBE1161126.1 VCBS repeat-containing protein [Dyella acidiphila]